jgi:hypothetical protein
LGAVRDLRTLRDAAVVLDTYKHPEVCARVLTVLRGPCRCRAPPRHRAGYAGRARPACSRTSSVRSTWRCPGPDRGCQGRHAQGRDPRPDGGSGSAECDLRHRGPGRRPPGACRCRAPPRHRAGYAGRARPACSRTSSVHRRGEGRGRRGGSQAEGAGRQGAREQELREQAGEFLLSGSLPSCTFGLRASSTASAFSSSVSPPWSDGKEPESKNSESKPAEPKTPAKSPETAAEPTKK